MAEIKGSEIRLTNQEAREIGGVAQNAGTADISVTVAGDASINVAELPRPDEAGDDD